METAKKNAEELQGVQAPAVPPVINKVHNTTGSTRYRCGKNHEPDKCKFKVHLKRVQDRLLGTSDTISASRLQQEEQINQLCKDNNPIELIVYLDEDGARHWSLSITDFRSNIY